MDYTALSVVRQYEAPPKIKYTLGTDRQYFTVLVDYPERYHNLREIPRENMSIPEQMLINTLIYQELKGDKLYYLTKDVLEKVVYYLKEIDPEQKIAYEIPTGTLQLTYIIELSPQYARISVDVTKSGFASMREIPRDQLPVEERLLLGFLSGIPLNAGSFFINQRLMAKLMYFLSKVNNVINKQSGKKISFQKEYPPYKLSIVTTPSGYALKALTNKTELTRQTFNILGDKEYCVVYKSEIYPLRIVDQMVLTPILNGISISADRLADFMSEYMPVFDKNQIVYQLATEVAQKKSRMIEKAPIPVLKLERDKKQTLKIEIWYDYGLKELVQFGNSLEDFYQAIVEDEEYYLKRDKKSEAWLDSFLQERRFLPTKKGYTITEDDFIDFFSYEYDGLKKNIGLRIEGENLQEFRYDEDVNFDLAVDFKESSGIDWFDFTPTYKVKGAAFTHQEIQDLIEKEKSYVRLPDGSLVKVPKKEYEYLQTYLAGRKPDAKSGKFKLKKHDIFYLYSSVREHMQAKVDDALQKLVDTLADFTGIPVTPLPTTVQGNPRNYQHDGFNWLLFLHDNHFHGILADDMGLGKTFQVLLLLTYLKEKGLKNRPSLIVAPTTVVYNWVEEVKKFAPNLKVLVLAGPKDRILKVKEIAKYDVVITSYALLRNDLQHYEEAQFYYMVLDEAQYIKNHKAQVTQAVKCIKADHRLAMTGTPIENRLTELWSIFDFLMPGFLSTAGYFRSIYEEDHGRLSRKIKPFVLRRTKAQVLSELPPKNEIDSFSELLPEQEQLYLSTLQAQKKELFTVINQKGIERSQLNILASLLKLRQICCHPALIKNEKYIFESAKFNQFKELIAEILESDSKVIVFSQFVQMLTIMRKYLESEKVDYAYLDGSTRDRQAVINDFHESKEKHVFLCSLKAGGFGINLTAANYVIIYDPWWNPAVEQQAMDRVYRIGQTKEVFVYKLITKGTVEEKILKLQGKKRQLIDVISQDFASHKLTKDDLEELFTV